MASSNDRDLCNGIPVDHRLKQFLPSAKRKFSQEVGKHADIVESFGNELIRDNGTYPSENEAGFAAWLAKPDLQGGLVIALLQPAKTQVYTSDFQWVKGQCRTLAYLDEALAFVNGSGGLTTTSVFDAFPFITDSISSEGLSEEARDAYNTFKNMLEAKKPDVVFACWRGTGQNQKLSFSGKGVGGTSLVENSILSNGHVVRVVNGFHPSYAVNYYPNESRFRRLFTIELCKAFCELNTTWQEDEWMKDLREKCRDRTREIMEEKEKDKRQQNSESDRVLRGSRENDSTKKHKAYTKSFDNGLQCLKQMFEHMVSPTYKSQSSRDLYAFLVFDQNTSEGICDCLLAISETMKRFKTDNTMPDSLLVELNKHIGLETRNFLKYDIPGILQHPKGIKKGLWSSQFARSTSQGLKRSMEKITISFVESLTDSFSESSKTWTYAEELIHNAFKNIAISFESALGEEYDIYIRNGTTSFLTSLDVLSATVYNLSLSSFEDLVSKNLVRDKVITRPSSSAICFNCSQSGHYARNCSSPRKGDVTPSRSSSKIICYSCYEVGHYSTNCTSPKKASNTPSRSSSTVTCYTCFQVGHYSLNCTSPKKQGKCFKCGEVGHYSKECRAR